MSLSVINIIIADTVTVTSDGYDDKAPLEPLLSEPEQTGQWGCVQLLIKLVSKW